MTGPKLPPARCLRLSKPHPGAASSARGSSTRRSLLRPAALAAVRPGEQLNRNPLLRETRSNAASLSCCWASKRQFRRPYHERRRTGV